jgi:hypothetical protein
MTCSSPQAKAFHTSRIWAAHKISILIIRSHTNQIEDLLPVVGTILAMLAEISRGRLHSRPEPARSRQIQPFAVDRDLGRLAVCPSREIIVQ